MVAELRKKEIAQPGDQLNGTTGACNASLLERVRSLGSRMDWDIPLEGQGASGLEELYSLHSSRAGQLAYLLTGDHALAEDLMQDAFVREIQAVRELT